MKNITLYWGHVLALVIISILATGTIHTVKSVSALKECEAFINTVEKSVQETNLEAIDNCLNEALIFLEERNLRPEWQEQIKQTILETEVLKSLKDTERFFSEQVAYKEIVKEKEYVQRSQIIVTDIYRFCMIDDSIASGYIELVFTDIFFFIGAIIVVIWLFSSVLELDIDDEIFEFNIPIEKKA